MKYQIECNEKQLRLISHALETIARIETGQIDSVIKNTALVFNRKRNTKDLDYTLTQLRVYLGFTSNGNYGISNEEVCQDAKESYDMYCKIRHELWKNDDNRSMIQVSSTYDKFEQSKEPEINIKRVKDDIPLIEKSIEDSNKDLCKRMGIPYSRLMGEDD